MYKNALLGLLSALAASGAHAQLSYAQAESLMNKYHCSGCHALDGPNHGSPSLRAIARHFASDPNAVEVLKIRVNNGSIGIFGDNPMPPMMVPESELEPLIKWILQVPLQP